MFKLSDLPVITFGLRIGPLVVFNVTLLEPLEDDEPEPKELPGTSNTIFGFQVDPVDEVNPRLDTDEEVNDHARTHKEASSARLGHR